MTFYFSALIVFLLDRISKYFIDVLMNPLDSIPIIPGIFHLTYIQNKGAAFGIFQDRILFFVLVTILVLAILIWVQHRYALPNPFLRSSLGLIMGGAVGNLWDRMLYGYVVDMFDFRVWPVFNLADSAIVVGVAVLGWYILRDPGMLEEAEQSGRE